MKILVSVIVPVHNGESYLRQCLDSIVNQTLRDIEIICIDDGSTDGSLKILEEYQRKDSRIRVISEEASNAGHARNVGLKTAIGMFLSFLDCDDWFELDMLEVMYAQSLKTDADVVICKAATFDQKSGKFSSESFSLQENLVPARICFSCKDIAADAFQFCRTAAWDKLYKKSFIDENLIQFQEQPRMNDCFFSVMANIRAKKISVCNHFFVHYRINTGTSITSNFKQTYPSTLVTIQKIWNSLAPEEQKIFVKSFKNFVLKIIFYEFLRFPEEFAFQYYKLLHSMDFKLEALKASEVYNPDLYELLTPLLVEPFMEEERFTKAFELFQKKYQEQRLSIMFLFSRKVRSLLTFLRTHDISCYRIRFENIVCKHILNR
ncbi:MAG: glycosyltransferase [Fibrobacteraceae bacterium]|nr:glycosyltransferase [Fibrobacteraceae bacterium]